MSEIKTLKFPGDTEPREIVDAKAREDISKLSTLPNPNALTIKIGSTTVTYDGSTAQTVELPIYNGEVK